jgi:flavin-dependent dehydrogenase
VVTQDGKGYKLNNPYTSIIITFLDKKKTGTFSFQFQAQNSNYIIEKPKFDKLLNSINIIK